MVIVKYSSVLHEKTTLNWTWIWLSGILIGASLTFAAYFCFVGESGDEAGHYSLPMHLTTRYSLEQMREFAYKNSVAMNYKPSLYTRWSLSFNRIMEDSENR